MTLWIDSNNTLHDDMNGEALSLPSWPKGMTQATQAQIDAIRNPIPTLSQAQAAQISALQDSYQAAINAPVSFKNAAGVTSTYAFGNTLTLGGTNAQALLTQILSAGSTSWTANVWFDTNGVAQTMTFADLQGLAAAVEAIETPDEQHLMTKIAAVQAATTVSAVQAVVW